MYKLEYLPLAQQDMLDIVVYITAEIKNAKAALKLADMFVTKADGLVEFPYKYEVYSTLQPLKHEYRRMVVENYNMFYWVEEKRAKVVIARVIYGKRNSDELLE